MPSTKFEIIKSYNDDLIGHTFNKELKFLPRYGDIVVLGGINYRVEKVIHNLDLDGTWQPQYVLIHLAQEGMD